jgi:flagellar biosynthesis protein FlhA
MSERLHRGAPHADVAASHHRLAQVLRARDRFEDAARQGEAPVLVTSPGVRPFVHSIVERFRAQNPPQAPHHARRPRPS